MKPRNPIAKNLNINKPKVIPDKRKKILEKEQQKEQKKADGKT